MIDFWNNLHPVLQGLLKGLAVICVIFPIAGASSMAERKVSAWLQGRYGPNRVIVPWFAWMPFLGRGLQRLGVFNLLADGGKLLFKQDPLPGHVRKIYFLMAPGIAIIPAFTTVTVVPFGAYVDRSGHLVPLMLANLDIGVIAVFAIASLGIYSMILAGWASNSKYPFLGSVRASAQLISYELSLTLSVLPVFLLINRPGMPATLSLVDVVQQQSGVLPSWHGLWLIFVMPVSALIFLVALFAETNRLPFDMIESEADLVGGFHTEYGAFKWSLFFVAEYSHMVVGSGVFVLIFFGGWNPLPFLPLVKLLSGLQHVTGWAFWLNPFVMGIVSIAIFLAKVLFMIFFFMWVRWTVPRFRYDQVMRIGWRRLLPLALANVVAYALAIAFLQSKG
jgi:NADH-quinone oxidoreductase subunit H